MNRSESESARSAVCRDCLSRIPAERRCLACGSPRVLRHDELFDLSVAHIDCDAFYASVEKRDHPELRDRPVIVGGGRRGVVSTACYVARTHGIHSAMPMFQAKRLCPDAVVIRPRMTVYSRISRQIRGMMEELTPLVEPLSLDEAFLDLTGTERLHGEPPAIQLARLAARIEGTLGLSVSIGLSHNKFLAKIGSDLDKPKGFSVIGREETVRFLADRPVTLIWGVGKSTNRVLSAMGIRTFRDLQRMGREALVNRFGAMGERLWILSHGKDGRSVNRLGQTRAKSLSNETTFFEDTDDPGRLDGYLWRLSQKVSDRAKAKGLAGKVVFLKVKRSNHRLLTRQTRFASPTQSANQVYRTSRSLLDQVIHLGPFRLIGVGMSGLQDAFAFDEGENVLDEDVRTLAQAERATDSIRARFGDQAIIKGRALR
ncbi:MAG: DNA polymerase IV [Paracoccaceae bacterium]|nr:DNA polymerase IV [Paracoccaceae bacterium]